MDTKTLLDIVGRAAAVAVFLSIFIGLPAMWTYYKVQECMSVGHGIWYCTGVHIFGG